MPRSILPAFRGAALLFGLCVLPLASAAEPPQHAAELLPESSVIYAELTAPKTLIDTVLEHPVTARVQKLDAYRDALAQPQARQAKLVFGLLEQQLKTKLNMTWREVAGAAAEGGIAFGFDPQTQGAALLVKSRDAQVLQTLREMFFQIARDEAKKKGNPDPIQEKEYRGLTAYELGEARAAIVGPWLIVVNKSELGEGILDRYLDGPAGALADNPRFQSGRDTAGTGHTGWIWADVARLKELGAAKELYRERHDNPLAEVLLGGLLGALQHAPYVVATIDFDNTHLALNLRTPFDATQISEARQYFFGPDGRGAAPAAADVPETVLSIGAYRNFSELWLNVPNLFDDRIDAGFSEANANLSTLFGGKDFGEDILGAFQPEVQIVAARQDFTERSPVPAIKLPAFGLVLRFRDAEQSRTEFRRMYQNLIGFLNIVGGMNGNPQMSLSSEKEADWEIQTATFDAGEDDVEGAASIHHNFSPSIGFAGDRFVVASTGELARVLTQGSATTNEAAPNTRIRLGIPVLAQLLDDNREQLIVQNMLKDGHEREEAEAQINLLLEGLSLLDHLEFRLAAGDSDLTLTLELTNREQANP